MHCRHESLWEPYGNAVHGPEIYTSSSTQHLLTRSLLWLEVILFVVLWLKFVLSVCTKMLLLNAECFGCFREAWAVWGWHSQMLHRCKISTCKLDRFKVQILFLGTRICWHGTSRNDSTVTQVREHRLFSELYYILNVQSKYEFLYFTKQTFGPSLCH